jgi:putative intracellular protease/amidase
MDPRSDDPAAQTPATRRYMSDLSAQAVLDNTLQLRQVTPTRFDAVFYCGGHGPLWDLAEDPASIALIDTLLNQGKPVAAVCHGPAVLRHARTREGTPVVQGRNVTGFSNTEEQAAGLTEVVPFLVEDMLTRLGGNYSKAADWVPHVVADGLLLTGQNPASSGPAAEALLALLRRRASAP